MKNFVIKAISIILEPYVLAVRDTTVFCKKWITLFVYVYTNRDRIVPEYFNNLSKNLSTLRDELVPEPRKAEKYIVIEELYVPTTKVKPDTHSTWWICFLYVANWLLFLYKHRTPILTAKVCSWGLKYTPVSKFRRLCTTLLQPVTNEVRDCTTLWRPIISRKSYNGVLKTKYKNSRM